MITQITVVNVTILHCSFKTVLMLYIGKHSFVCPFCYKIYKMGNLIKRSFVELYFI